MACNQYKLAFVGLLITAISSGCDHRHGPTPEMVGTSSNSHQAQAAASGIVRLKNSPPRPKDVLDALLSSSEVPLSVDSSCAGFGTEVEDQTIGRYLSGFLVELSDPTAANAIVATADLQERKQGMIWFCSVMIQHAAGEDVWRWGVTFEAGQNDGVVKFDSFRCLGAG